MKRTIFALAIAGLSFSALALPPPGDGPPILVDVNVTNQVLPVEVSNADPIPVVVTTQPASTLYYHRLFATCTAQNVCLAEFPAVPAGKRLVLTNVRLFASQQPAAEGIFVVRRMPLPLVVFPVSSFQAAYFGTAYAANHQVELIFGPDEKPVLELGIPGGSGTLVEEYVRFGVTGHLVDD